MDTVEYIIVVVSAGLIIAFITIGVITVANDVQEHNTRIDKVEKLCYPYKFITSSKQYVICAGPEGEVLKILPDYKE